jgi:oxygen-independent coproporphyrinogen-3 oxidase
MQSQVFGTLLQYGGRMAMLSVLSPSGPDEADFMNDPAFVRHFGAKGPRYTSYPAADRFVEAFNADNYGHWLANRDVGGMNKPLSLYVHLPFCASICYYCGCNKIITKDHGRSAKYIGYVLREAEMQSALLHGSHQVAQMHWGGGTPTFLSIAEMRELMQGIRRFFDLLHDGEHSIEIDPRGASPEAVEALAQMGFNRASIGVQDFDPEVQLAIHRQQSEEQTLGVLRELRSNGFKSVNFDLIYGLPKQNSDGFRRTLETVIQAGPDRIALYSYAHLPTMFKPQRRIADADLPMPAAKLDLLSLAIRSLSEAGYVYIGMDHFAKPGDDLARAQRQGRLHRNFQGYSTHADSDLLAFGVSAIGKVGPTYAQNLKTLDDYYQSIDRGILPVMRGLELDADDLLRRSIIQSLICHFELSVADIEMAHFIKFESYFAREIEELKKLEEEELVTVSDKWITVTMRGRMLVRAVCAVFDKYLRTAEPNARYSRLI